MKNIQKNIRRFLILLAWLLMVSFLPTGKALAVDPFYKRQGEVAASGYDVVAYFTQGKPVEGNQKWKTNYRQHSGQAVFYFSSKENLELFRANPKKYAPQFGGYCAYAVGKNYTAKSDPDAFTVHQGRLYLNYNLSVRKLWLKDRDNLITNGKKNWPILLKE